jgi:large subunit ribosomal protein L27
VCSSDLRQRGTQYHAGVNAGLGSDHTVYALVDGQVHFRPRGPKNRLHVDIVPAA